MLFFYFFGLKTALRVFPIFCISVEDNRAHGFSKIVFLKKFLIPDYRGIKWLRCWNRYWCYCHGCVYCIRILSLICQWGNLLKVTFIEGVHIMLYLLLIVENMKFSHLLIRALIKRLKKDQRIFWRFLTMTLSLNQRWL